MSRLFLLLGLVACSADKNADSGTAPDTPVDYRERGPHRVGVQKVAATATTPPFLVYAPTALDESSQPLSVFEDDPDRATLIDERVGAAPSGCPTTGVSVSPTFEATADPLPVVLMSHCHECTWSSLATVATHLASHGVAVLAVSHEGNTFFDVQAGTNLPLDTDTLAVRVDQLDAVWHEGVDLVEANLDLSRVATVGHSFGAVTTGMVAQREGAVLGSVFLGAPADNPLLSGVDATALTAPNVWLLLEEDNSIGQLGNDLIVDNATNAPGPTRLVRMPDAGHWSVSDIVGIDDAFMPGCGTDTRQDGSGDTFTYPDAATARETTAGLVAAAVVPWLVDGNTDVGDVDALDGWNDLVVEAP